MGSLYFCYQLVVNADFLLADFFFYQMLDFFWFWCKLQWTSIKLSYLNYKSKIHFLNYYKLNEVFSS